VHKTAEANTLANLACRFDYFRLENGTRQPGTSVSLHADGCVDFSSFSPAELTAVPDVPPPTADELDYALLRLATPIGTIEQRGWVSMHKGRTDLAKGTALLIPQHPDGAPLKLAMDTDAVIGFNAGGTRLKYATNTEPGSSGSPCFSMDWELLALHHLGDPAWNKLPEYNQGVPISLIRDRIAARGHGALLGA
jgi:hypothetical protein